MNVDQLILLIIACLAVNLTPGPSVLLVSSVSAARGFRAGLFAVLGMTAGAFVHVVLAASGVAALLAAAPAAFKAIQWLGAAYLIYLGLMLLRPPRIVNPPATGTHSSNDWAFFRRGLLVDALNPKIAIFFLAFIPQFLHAVDDPGFIVSLLLGSVFLCTGAIVNGSIAWAVAAGSARMRGPMASLMQRWLPGAVLIFLGLRLLWEEH